MKKKTPRKPAGPPPLSAREVEREAARRALARQLKREKQIRALTRQLMREVGVADRGLRVLAQAILERDGEAEPPSSSDLGFQVPK